MVEILCQKRDLKRASRLLWMLVPAPAPPPLPKLQKSWATLSQGQHLELLEEWKTSAISFPSGSRFEVFNPTSAGVALRPVAMDPLTNLPCNPIFLGPPIPWREKDWKKYFKRVRRPSGKRKKKIVKETTTK